MGLGLNKFLVFDRLDYKPHEAQRRIHSAGERMKVVTAGRRFGKSELGGEELVPEALLTYTMKDTLKAARKRREFWIVGPEYSDSEKEFRVVWNQLTKAEIPFDKPGSYNSPWAGEMSISAFNGTFQVHAKSAKYPNTLVGEGLSGVILSEAAKLKANVWHKFIRPTLADYRGWALFTTTPEGKNWLYDLWLRGQDPHDEHWASFRMPSWLNDIVFPMGATTEGIKMIRDCLADPQAILTPEVIKASGVDEEIVDMARDMTEERFAQEIGAEFTEFVGRVFKLFDEEIHLNNCEYDPRYPVDICVDYGWTNPFVALAVQKDVWDNVNVLAEYRTTRRDIEDIAADLKTYHGGLFAKGTNLYPDPGSPGDTAVLVKHLRYKAHSNTGGELKWRLELIRRHLKLVPEHRPYEQRAPKLFFNRNHCADIVREMNDYRYPDTKKESDKEEPENPMKKDDHGPEALGRYFRGVFGAPGQDEDGGRAKVRRAKVSA